MKNAIAIFFHLLCVLNIYSQSSVSGQPHSISSLNKYIWSFSKNSAKTGAKPLIDFDVMDNWRGLGDYLAVSDDGKYFSYTINKNDPDNLFRRMHIVDTLVVQSTKTTWRQSFAGSEPGFFSTDGRQYIFNNNGILCFLKLGSGVLRKLGDVSSYKVAKNEWIAYRTKGKDALTLQNLLTGGKKNFPGLSNYDFDKNGQWLICKNDSTKELMLYNLSTGSEKHYAAVDDYLLAEKGNSLLLKTAHPNTTSLQYVSLLQGMSEMIWSTKEKTGIGSYCIDASGGQVIFTVSDNENTANTGIWYYKAGMAKAVLKVSNQDRSIPTGMNIGTVSFSNDGRYLKFYMEADQKEPAKPNIEMAGLEVWNHKDLYLQSMQSQQIGRNLSYAGILNLKSGKVVFAETKGKKIISLQGDFAIVRKDGTPNYGDRFWEQGMGWNKDSAWIISLKNGNIRLLPIKLQMSQFWFSPSGNYLVYFDETRGCHYYSYDLRTGVAKNLTLTLPENELGITDRQFRLEKKPAWGCIAAWMENDADVLVYDNYDIWKLDLRGKLAAVNITNGFGQTNSTILNLFETNRYSYNRIPILKVNASLILRGYNTNNKRSGFYKKVGVKVGDPEEIFMGNYFINIIEGCHDLNFSNKGMTPLKAANTDSWIVQRQSSNDAPNFYKTNDFKSFKRLTDFQPQKGYQWLTEELHSFKYLDGKSGQGILYRPESFDPTKKYPVLIVFYNAFSDNLHQFRIPTGIEKAISPGASPVWFLNNSYLVFTPDISVAPLKYGPKAFSVIEGAAQYLKTLPYVDGNRLGCASHSWSAKLGAYVFTHSKSFAATAISEGFLYADMINVALGGQNEGKSKLEDVEKDFQFGNLWDNKDRWLDQTTVLNADKSNSALLLFCNKESSSEYQDQTLQFFTALRRLDKNVWWLKYDKGGHTLSDPQEVKDYTIRYTQFFDHYLKNAPAPQWMTQGIPYKLKRIESRYELDPQGTCNAPNGELCTICAAWNEQYKRTPEMFQKEIKDWVLDNDITDQLERKINEKRRETDKEGEMQAKEVLQKLNSK
jgi:dipeptidyl aminopeptidase/acylaminoacyl peptidase